MSDDKTVSVAALRAVAERCGLDARLHDAEKVLAAAEVLEAVRAEEWDEDNDWHYEQERLCQKYLDLQERIKP